MCEGFRVCGVRYRAQSLLRGGKTREQELGDRSSAASCSPLALISFGFFLLFFFALSYVVPNSCTLRHEILLSVVHDSTRESSQQNLILCFKLNIFKIRFFKM